MEMPKLPGDLILHVSAFVCNSSAVKYIISTHASCSSITFASFAWAQ